MRLFDLHCDTLSLGLHNGVSISRHTGAVDMDRGQHIHPWIQAFAAFLPDARSPAASFCECKGLLDIAQQWEQEQPDCFRILRSVDDLDDGFGGCHCLLTVENGGALGADLPKLDWLRERHVRMVGLTWNGDNAWGSGCGGTAGAGLTDHGRRAVSRLERLGMVVDVSHLNAEGFWQVAAMASRPFVASHSNAAAVCPHPRNLTDDQFRAVRDSGGLVGVNLYPLFLGGHELTDIQRHIEHFLALDGEKTVCFGADLDGMTPPPQWNGLSVMAALWEHLLQEGYALSLLENIFYQNAHGFFRRVFRENP